MKNIRLIFKGVSEIIGDEDLCLLILTDMLETRQIGIVCDQYMQQQFNMRMGQRKPSLPYLPEVLCSMVNRRQDESYEIHILDIVNGDYVCEIVDRFSNFRKRMRAGDAILLSLISDIPLFIDTQLMMRQSVPYQSNSMRLSIPVNAISDSMLQHAMDKAVEESMQTAVPQITASLVAAKEENAQAVESLKWVKILLSLRTFILCAAACALLALIIFFINMNVFAMFKYVSIPAIVDGALLFAAAALCGTLLPSALSVAAKEAGLPSGIFEALWAYATTLFLQMKIWGAVTAVCGVVLCVLGFVLDKKAAKNEGSQSLAS